MELQFHQTNIPCLKQILENIKDLELTQEIKLSDGMPDIGSVITAWGQVLIRGKEWREDRIGASGGVQVWVLYAPEDGTDPRMVEAWMPFQTQWEIPEGLSEGKICLLPRLRLIDARSVAARRLMVRAAVSLLVKAMLADQVSVCTPGDMPEDVQLKICTYPVRVPCEAGEKAFVMDEELSLPAGSPTPEKLLRYSLQPQITEVKVMAGKLVFRGSAVLQVLYRTEAGLHSTGLEIPFAQYAELEGEYDPEATAWVFPAVTSLEMELGEEGRLRLKAGLVGQYILCDKKELSVAEDAYSTQRELTPQIQPLQLPLVLEDRETRQEVSCPWDEEGQLVDSVFYPDHPRQIRNADSVENQLTGRFHLLYYDAEGVLRGSTCKWEQQIPMQAHENSRVCIYAEPMGQPEATQAQLRLSTLTVAEQGMETVCGLTLGDTARKDPDRPSLILRRVGNETLWQLAKRTGSTVSAIQNANGLESEEPSTDRMLLIPVP